MRLLRHLPRRQALLEAQGALAEARAAAVAEASLTPPPSLRFEVLPEGR